jgi:ADP-ribose pyrophosphatase
MIRYTNTWFSVIEEDSYFRISNHLAQVVVLPVVAGTDVVMVKVKRPLLGDSVWELPAGAIETGETPLEGAQRELREETGIDSTAHIRWTPRGQLAVMPNRMSELAHIFRADIQESSWESRREHDDEISSVARWSFDEVVTRVAQRDLFVTLPMAVILREQALVLIRNART